MSRHHSVAIDYLVYLAVRFLFLVIQALPFATGRALALFFAWLAYHVDRRHRLVAIDNLSRAFPEKTPAEVDELTRAVYRHFCTMLVEMVHLPRYMVTTTWRRHLELANGREILEALIGDRPALFVTGHLGNWEMGGFAMGLLGFSTYAIARKLDNRFLHDYLMVRFRERTGQTILSKDGEFERIQAALASGGMLATLGDQDAGQRGLFVDYFGRPASTHKAVALLALEYGAPLLVIATVRVGEPMRYRCAVEEVIRPEEYAGRPDAVRQITQRFTSALERLVRKYPEQYLWLHRRWKHQPKEKKEKQAA